MRTSTPPRMHVVTKEEKEQRLKDFIKQDFVARRDAGAGNKACYVLIARSAASPVVTALAAAAAEMPEIELSVRAIFANLAPEPAGESKAGLAFISNLRVATDPRLLDAHELLVLSPAAAWIGDCMRRDPSKRDAYELYSNDSSDVCGWAAVSFARLWEHAATPAACPAIKAPKSFIDEMPPKPILTSPEAMSGTEIATRH